MRAAADPAGKLRAQAALLVVAALEALAQVGILAGSRPALDAAAGLEPRDRRDQMRAGQVVGRRERLARLVERGLLGDRRPAERAADGDAAERARGPAELALDDRAVIVHRW